MSWWGKLVGGTFGFMLGGLFGALLGAALGHNFDKGITGFSDQAQSGRGRQERVQTAFFTATFSVMGHICKADGRISEDELDIARRVMADMQLSAAQKRAAIALFNEGKKAGFPLDDVLRQLRRETGLPLNLRRMFIEIQCYAAYADNHLHPAEKRLLYHVCEILGFPRHEMENILRSVGAQFHRRQGRTSRPAEKDAYAILGLSAQATDAEVKRAYRRLMSQHHPDKLVSKGLPEEMMKIATQRTHEIRQAYESIKERRGF